MTIFRVGDIVELTEKDNHDLDQSNESRKRQLLDELGTSRFEITEVYSSVMGKRIMFELNFSTRGHDSRRFKKPNPRERNKRLLESKKQPPP
jgi:hypothetical protein